MSKLGGEWREKERGNWEETRVKLGKEGTLEREGE